MFQLESFSSPLGRNRNIFGAEIYFLIFNFWALVMPTGQNLGKLRSLAVDIFLLQMKNTPNDLNCVVYKNHRIRCFGPRCC